MYLILHTFIFKPKIKNSHTVKIAEKLFNHNMFHINTCMPVPAGALSQFNGILSQSERRPVYLFLLRMSTT